MRRGPPALPPPWARRSPGGAVIAYVCRRWEVAEAVSMSSSRLDGQRWRCGVGGPSPPPPPRARRSPGTDFAFDCRRHHVNGLRVAFGCRHCQGGVAVVASMAHASTDGLCDAARAAPRPPRALVIPLAPRSHSVAAVADEEWQSGVVKSMPEGSSILRRLST